MESKEACKQQAQHHNISYGIILDHLGSSCAKTPGTIHTYHTWDRKFIHFAPYRLCTSVVSAYRAIVLASPLSCSTRAFCVDSTFYAHSLVARPHLSIRVCVSVCHSLLLVYLFHLQICESYSTLSIYWTNICLNFVPLLLTKPLDKLYFVGVSEQVEYQFHYSLSSH